MEKYELLKSYNVENVKGTDGINKTEKYATIDEIIDGVCLKTCEGKEEDIKKNIKMMDATIEHSNRELMCNFFRQGLKFGIFDIIDRYHPKMEDLSSLVNYPNKSFVMDYVSTAIDLGMIVCEDGVLSINEDFEISIGHPKYKEVITDYIMKYDFISDLAKYALIGYRHPNILLNFTKDADIWDMILSSIYFQTCRNIAAEYLDIQNGDYVLDVGCGSRSPEFYGSRVSPNGCYMGVDISKNLLKIADNRVRRIGLDCVSLKPINFCDVIPKKKYDYAICTFTLKYSLSIKIFLKKMMESLHIGGKIFIAEEFFVDDTNVNVKLFEFYNKLNKHFERYVSKEEIIEALNSMGYDFSCRMLGKSIMVIEKRI